MTGKWAACGCVRRRAQVHWGAGRPFAAARAAYLVTQFCFIRIISSLHPFLSVLSCTFTSAQRLLALILVISCVEVAVRLVLVAAPSARHMRCFCDAEGTAVAPSALEVHFHCAGGQHGLDFAGTAPGARADQLRRAAASRAAFRLAQGRRHYTQPSIAASMAFSIRWR